MLPPTTHSAASFAAPTVPAAALVRYPEASASHEPGLARDTPERGEPAPWFPADHLFTPDAAHTRALLVALSDQARLLDDVLAACAAGAASLPPTLHRAVQLAAVAMAATHGGAGPPA